MKRCPECRRDYYDDTLQYCLDDGNELLEGPASAGEAPTVILETTEPSGEAATSTKVGITGHEAVLPTGSGDTTRNTGGLDKRLLAIPALLAIIVFGGYFGYRYVSSGGPNRIESIAVMPFVNVSGDPNAEYLSDGITESIINSLSQLPNLGVIARNSVFRYKGKDIDAVAAGRELNVRALLTGRVIQRGDNLSINVELVDTNNNHQLWGQQYNRKIADVFVVQEEIAKEISEKLRVKLTGTEQKQHAKRPTENIKAFQYYVQGRTFAHRRTREDLLTAISFCEKAIAEDGSYALAYTGLADAYANLGVRDFIDPAEGRRKADEAARKALALDENLGEAHFAISQSKVLFAPYDLPLANRELLRALELSPSLAAAHQYLGISLAIQGQNDRSLDEYSKAQELDPLSSSIARGAAFPYYLKRDYPRALEMLHRANELGPPFSVFWEAQAYALGGFSSQALLELDAAKKARKTDQVLTFSEGLINATIGKRTEALAVVKDLENMSGGGVSQAQYIARIYLAMGEKDQAFKWLDMGLKTGALTGFYPYDPFLDPLRGDARFDDLLKRIGMPQ